MNSTVDIVVIGSGAAGLTAALTAACNGASVVVLEKSDKIGGTTAVSGGLLWVPMNPKGAEVGFRDSRQAAIDYITGTAGELTDPALVERFVDAAADTVRFLEANSAFVAVNTPYPDTFAEAKGGVRAGRHIECAPFNIRRLGRWRKHLRAAPMPSPMTSGEMLAVQFISDFRGFLRKNILKMAWRLLTGVRAAGMGLVASVLKGCIDKGVRFSLQTRVVELVQDGSGRVTGVVAESSAGRQRFEARRGVILASGGFEWDEKLAARYLPAPLGVHPSPPGLSSGDSIRLAEQVAAPLHKMHMYWNWPAGKLPGSSYEGREIGTLVFSERMLPHSVWVNARGERFCNESDHNVTFAFEQREPNGAWCNRPAWAIVDSQYRNKYPILFKVMPGSADPKWLIKADTPAQLAKRIGVDARKLEETLARFNDLARSGRDVDFGRGNCYYERTLGDTKAPHPNLGTVEHGPFYAIEVFPAAVGTRGGPATDVDGRVLGPHGTPIPGLYAAGNAAAGFCGPKIIGGVTIIPAMTFARLAVEAALRAPVHA